MTGPILLGRAIDDLRTDLSVTQLTRYALWFLGLGIVGGLLQFQQRYLVNRIWCHIEYDLRQDFYAHLLRQALSFFKAHRTGDLMARAASDIASAGRLVEPMFLDGLQTALVILIALPVMFWINLRLTLLLLLIMPLVIVNTIYLGQYIQARFEKAQEFLSTIIVRAQQNLTGVRLIRAYAQEDLEVAAFNELHDKYNDLNLGILRISAVVSPLTQFVLGLGFVMVIWYGGMLALSGVITVGEFTMFNLYMVRLAWPLISMGSFINILQRGIISLKRLDSILSIKPSITDAPGVCEQPPIAGGIEFRNLSFSYSEQSALVIRDVTLTVEPGQKIAFIGRMGSGKSTLMNLIVRLMEAPRDTVLIDGIPIYKYPLAQLRASIGYVPQESSLFSDTIAGNIAFGVKQADRASIEAAAAIAGLEADLRSFPLGLDTLVGERGVTLSGGQKQRLAIARAVLRHPKILILDDAVSAIDTATEEEILARLRDVMRDCTTLIVTQRLAAVCDAHLICVLDEGRIIERGTHDELLMLGGKYAYLCWYQAASQEVGFN